MIQAIINYVAYRPWAWVVFKYTVLPVCAVWDICKDRLPAIVAEYHSDVVQMEADIQAIRAASKFTVTTPPVR